MDVNNHYLYVNNEYLFLVVLRHFEKCSLLN